MYQVILVNLTPDARHADSSLGPGESHTCNRDELSALLEAFRGIDPAHRVEPEPEIRVQYRGGRYVVNVTQGRLLLANARDRSRPTLPLDVAEILAELEGSAVTSRGEVPLHIAAEFGKTENAGAPASSAAPGKHRARVVTLCTAAVVLLAGIALLAFSRDVRPRVPFDPLPAAELANTARTVAAVYVTGSEPGDRGIVIGSEGVIRIFELNAAGAPSFVHGTWHAGRSHGALRLRIPELGTLVEIVDAETIVYCGQRYRRAASS